jgi:SET domain
LSGDEVFVRSLSNALGEEGILVSQFGEDVKFNSAGANFSPRVTEHNFIEKLKDHAFTKIEDYAESHGGFLAVWKYKIAFKCIECSYYLWHSNQATIDLEIRKRTLPVVDGSKENLLRFFDGATMIGYQYPSRVVENVFCRDFPTPEYCDKMHGYDPDINNLYLSSLEIKASLIPNAGRGVVTKIDVPKGSYVVLDETTSNVLVMPTTTELIQSFLDAAVINRWKLFDAYLFGLGFASDYFGEPSFHVDNSLLQFINHGCNGTNNLQFYNVTEVTADPTKMAAEVNITFESTIYNPYVSRSHINLQNGGDRTNRDIKAGEELLDTYLSYYSLDTWERGIIELREQCYAQRLGSVRAYEESSN